MLLFCFCLTPSLQYCTYIHIWPATKLNCLLTYKKYYDLCFQGLCGNIIDEALSVICGKNGYAGKNHKRSIEFDPGKFMSTPLNAS